MEILSDLTWNGRILSLTNTSSFPGFKLVSYSY